MNVALPAAATDAVGGGADAARAQPHTNKPTPAQKMLLAKYLKKYPELAKGRLPGENAASRATQWRTLTERLNALGGCDRTLKQWREFCTDKARRLAARRYHMRNAFNDLRPRRVLNQPGLVELRTLIQEHERARVEDRRLDFELRRQHLDLQRQQLDVNQQLLEALRMQTRVLVEILQEIRQQR